MDSCRYNGATNNMTVNKIEVNPQYNNSNDDTNAFDWNNIVENTMCSSDDEFTSLQENIIPKKNNIEQKRDDKSPNLQDNYCIIQNNKLEELTSDLEILNITSLLARNLKFQYKKKFTEEVKDCVDWITVSLKWIHKSCEFLMIKYKQVSQCNNKKSNTLSRNSYKFCEYGYDCKFNYSQDNHCFSQHFVYNLVSSDIYHLLNFIDGVKVYDEESRDEIRISINTITYVINHMYEELFKLKKYRDVKYENFIRGKYLPENKKIIKKGGKNQSND